jgi:cathepsin A (carboxypeptidase C)
MPDLSLTHPQFPLHRLRVVEPELCDPNVHQLSGYLDISETRHLFFWFEESRRNPPEDPLVLWYVTVVNLGLITDLTVLAG